MLGSIVQMIAVLPELLLTAAALGLIATARIWRRPALLGMLTLAALGGALVALIALLAQQPTPQEMFHGMVVRTPLVGFFQMGILGVMILVTLAALGYRPLADIQQPEFFGLLLLSAVGLLLVSGAQNLIMVYVGLELVSLTSYLLTGFLRREASSTEGGLKYFLFGALATGLMLYGLSWLYGATGTLDLVHLTFLTIGGIHPNQPLLVVGFMFLTVGLGFKVGVVPFHHWAPDAYEGAPTPIAAFISAGPKLAGFALFVRIFCMTFQGLAADWTPILEAIAILTMTLGNVAALWQTNVKRLLAYSSIAQAGYIVIGLAVATPLGAAAVGFYTIAYALMNLAAFACVIAVSNAAHRDDLNAYAGLAQRHPALAAAFAISLLSLAGIPPTAGFLAKVWVFAAALDAGRLALAIVAAVNSVIAVYYYAGVLRQMYLVKPAPTAAATAQSPWPLTAAIGASLAGVLLLGLWPTPLWTWITQVTSYK